MERLDKQKNSTEIEKNLVNAMKQEDEQVLAKSMRDFADSIQQNIIQEAKSVAQNEVLDNQAMAARGLNVLSASENKYYNEVIANKGFGGVEQLVPPTVFERVFENLTQAHPLLAEINFVNTTATTEWIYSKGVNPAWWGKLCEPIKELLDNGFERVRTGLFKLSAYIPVCKAMLDLGPQWLDRYIRTVLAESMYIALEEAIVAGTGRDQPIGIIKDLDTVQNGVHADKKAESLKDLGPKTIGEKIMVPLTNVTIKKADGTTTVLKRAVQPAEVMLIVHPDDYWTTFFPATTFLNANGSYVRDVLPLPFKVIQSISMPKGKMAAGVSKDYFMGVGSTQKIEVSDEYHFVEDERIYLAKQYANGRPKNNESFLLFDISKVPSDLAFNVKQNTKKDEQPTP